MLQCRTQITQAIAAGMLDHFSRDEFPMNPEKFVLAIGALVDGLLFAYFQAPDQFTEDLIVGAFEAMAR